MPIYKSYNLTIQIQIHYWIFIHVSVHMGSIHLSLLWVDTWHLTSGNLFVITLLVAINAKLLSLSLSLSLFCSTFSPACHCLPVYHQVNTFLLGSNCNWFVCLWVYIYILCIMFGWVLCLLAQNNKERQFNYRQNGNSTWHKHNNVVIKESTRSIIRKVV